MEMAGTTRWTEANQQYLLVALALVRHALEKHCALLNGQSMPADSLEEFQRRLSEAAAAMPAPSSLETLSAAFGLSAFERALLLLCAGVELDSEFRGLCARASGLQQHEVPTSSLFPTFSLALATLPGGHWDALTPDAPLRRWRLITVGNGTTLTLSSLRIDEAILHYLAGLPYQDERLRMLDPAPVQEEELVPSHLALANRLFVLWGQYAAHSLASKTSWPVIHLCGSDGLSKHTLAAQVCRRLGLGLRVLSADLLPGPVVEIELVARLWEREALLTRSALLLDCDELELEAKGALSSVRHFLQLMRSPLILSSRERVHLWARFHNPPIVLDVERPETDEQRQLWRLALGELAHSLNGHVERLTMQFNLHSSDIVAASKLVARQPPDSAKDVENIEALLWETCRSRVRPALDNLAQRRESRVAWSDLVLPQPQVQLLHEIVAHVRQRATVYETWGFGRKGERGLGISALFAGSSGTGKTLAAEVLARELRLDLYRVDLSAVVSKYIGETEKNLRRIFDAAEEGGTILLFDEADALFGKRSEVKDSHDRYANIEVSYLLQRMEEYHGLAILTTNLKSALDTAFLRRIRFIVQFPFPDAEMRAEIWQHIFPASMPSEQLDIEKLAQLHIAGGNIRNIALHAAFLAADAGEPVRMSHLARAANVEYNKLEKSLTEAEIGGWQ